MYFRYLRGFGVIGRMYPAREEHEPKVLKGHTPDPCLCFLRKVLFFG